MAKTIGKEKHIIRIGNYSFNKRAMAIYMEENDGFLDSLITASFDYKMDDIPFGVAVIDPDNLKGSIVMETLCNEGVCAPYKEQTLVVGNVNYPLFKFDVDKLEEYDTTGVINYRKAFIRQYKDDINFLGNPTSKFFYNKKEDFFTFITMDFTNIDGYITSVKINKENVIDAKEFCLTAMQTGFAMHYVFFKRLCLDARLDNYVAVNINSDSFKKEEKIFLAKNPKYTGISREVMDSLISWATT